MWNVLALMLAGGNCLHLARVGFRSVYLPTKRRENWMRFSCTSSLLCAISWSGVVWWVADRSAVASENPNGHYLFCICGVHYYKPSRSQYAVIVAVDPVLRVQPVSPSCAAHSRHWLRSVGLKDGNAGQAGEVGVRWMCRQTPGRAFPIIITQFSLN